MFLSQIIKKKNSCTAFHNIRTKQLTIKLPKRKTKKTHVFHARIIIHMHVCCRDHVESIFRMSTTYSRVSIGESF